MVKRSRESGAKQSTKTRNAVKVTPKTEGQKVFLDSIRDNTITFCSGFAGTGKSLLSIWTAMELIQAESENYHRIYIVRPALEACGEKIGFLPGGANDKMRPYIQPIVDNLRVFIKDEGYISRLLEPTMMGPPQIEVIPMSFMRGRTFNNCVVIFDEAQNATPAQMKMFLTRIGTSCKVIVEGDVTQSDAFRNRSDNGLFDAMRRLRGIASIGICTLEASDIQRSDIIAPILERYKDIDGF